MGAIHLVRHAQASFGGPVYDVLSDTGHLQAARLGEALAERLPRVDRVVTGSLQRQRDTATACLAAMGASTDVSADARWDEYDHERIVAAADLAGVDGGDDPGRAFQAALDVALEQWAGAGDDERFGETYPAYRARVDAALSDVARSLGRGEVAVVFSSAGSISAASANVLGAPVEGWLRLNRVLVNTGITTLVTGRAGLSLLSVNEHAHVTGRHRELLTYR
jgi:broad specificity phosphatase PhoE